MFNYVSFSYGHFIIQQLTISGQNYTRTKGVSQKHQALRTPHSMKIEIERSYG